MESPNVLVAASLLLHVDSAHMLKHPFYICYKFTKILEVNLFAFAYRLFHRDFSPLLRGYFMFYVYVFML